MNAADQHIRAGFEAGDVGKLRSHLIGWREEILLTANDEDANGKDGQRDENECAEARNA
jgi:hypothetical protein